MKEIAIILVAAILVFVIVKLVKSNKSKKTVTKTTYPKSTEYKTLPKERVWGYDQYGQLQKEDDETQEEFEYREKEHYS